MWPDLVTKSSPICLQISQKVARAFFKVSLFKIAPKSYQLFGNFCKNICGKDLSRIGPIWSHWRTKSLSMLMFLQRKMFMLLTADFRSLPEIPTQNNEPKCTPEAVILWSNNNITKTSSIIHYYANAIRLKVHIVGNYLMSRARYLGILY